MSLDALYSQMPVVFQNVACSLYGVRERRVRLGTEFRRRYEWLLGTEDASRAEMTSYQDERVADLVSHAYRTVPYYSRLMDEHGLKPTDVACVSDLEKLPILRKSDVIAYRDEMLSSAYPSKRMRSARTSGTTGTALAFNTTPEAVAFQWAVWWRHRARFGVRPLDLHLNFTVKPAVPISQKHAPYWRWNLPMHQALVGMQHITRENAAVMARFAGSHRFVFYSGYPSLIHRFAEVLEEEGLRLDSASWPRCVFLGAENTHEFQREAIERLTGAVVTDQYGFAEGCGNASRCEFGVYHEDWEFGVLECLNPEPWDAGGTRGRIVATGFANAALPFIRYEIGDVAVWEPAEYQCQCGRQSRVIRHIEGRSEDYVLTPEGTRIMRFGNVFSSVDGVREAQVFQDRLGEITIRLAVRACFSPSDELLIRERIKSLVSPSLGVTFDFVDQVPRSSSGKFKAVVSELQDRAESEAK